MGSVDVREGDVVVPIGSFAEDSFHRCGSQFEEETNNNNRTTPDSESETPDGSSASWESWPTNATTPGVPSYIAKDANSLTFQWTPTTSTGDVVPLYQVEMQQLNTPSTIGDIGWDTVYSGNETWTQVKSLSPGRCYAVRVRCRLMEKVSEYTKAVVFRTTQTAPSGMQPPELSCLEHDAMTLRWRAPGESGGAEIKEYRLQLRPPSGNSELKEFDDVYVGAETSCRVKNLCPLMKYAARIKAINEIGEGPWSLISCFKTNPYVPEIPRNLTAKPTTPGSVQLAWTSGRQNGRRRDQYEIEIEHVERRCCRYHPSGTAFRQEIVGLECGREYRFRIRGENEVGKGDWSYPYTLTIPLCIPSQPSRPRLTSAEQTGVQCCWLQPSVVGGVQPLHYQLEIISMASSMLEGCMRTWQVVYAGSDCDSYIKDLVPGCDYSVRVKAKNEVGWGSASASLQFRTSPGLPLKPLVPHAVERYDRSMRIYWIPPAHDGGRLIQKYRLQMCPTDRLNDLEDDDPFSDVYEGSRNSTMIDDLQPGRVYAFRVRAVNPIGQGSWSDFGYESTPPGPPMPPGNLKSSKSQPTSLHLTWTLPESNGGSTIDGYQLEMAKADRGASRIDADCSFVRVYEGTALEWTSMGLDPMTRYWIRVRAINDRGYGDWSPLLETETVSDLPSAPIGLQISKIACTNVQLTWHPPQSDTKIAVEVSTSNGDWTERSRTSTDGCHIDGLDPGSTVAFRIRGINENGFGPYSEVLTTVTDLDPPEIPSPPIVGQSTATGIRLKWTTMDDRSIRCYRLEVKGTDGMLFETDVDGTVFKLNDLTPETTYEFRLAAVNASGSSPWSNATKTKTKSVPPLPPFDLRASPIETSIDVDWSTASSENLRFEVEAYLHGSKKNKNLQPIVRETVTDCRCRLSGFDRNQKYEIRVRSVSEGSIGKWSSVTIVKIPEAPSTASSKIASTVTEALPDRTKKGKCTTVSRIKHPIRRRKSIRKMLKSYLPFIVIVIAICVFLALILHK